MPHVQFCWIILCVGKDPDGTKLCFSSPILIWKGYPNPIKKLGKENTHQNILLYPKNTWIWFRIEDFLFLSAED